MIPKFIKRYPDAFETPDPTGTESQKAAHKLLTKIDEYVEEWTDAIDAIRYLHNPDRCPERYLSYLGYFLSANIRSRDSERQKRKKCHYAVLSHKNRGLWIESVKPLLDNITGHDSSLYDGTNTFADNRWLGTADDPPASVPWSYWGGDGTAPYSMSWLGDGRSYGDSGVIAIDLGSDSITQDVIDAVVYEIKDYILPAYMILLLGWSDAMGFHEYSGGVI